MLHDIPWFQYHTNFYFLSEEKKKNQLPKPITVYLSLKKAKRMTFPAILETRFQPQAE